MEPHISVIIPSGRPEMVGETIKYLEQQDINKGSFEVVVVSPKADQFYGTSENLRVVRVSVAHLYPPGKMRNIGAAAAHGDLFAFIDDDCLPPSNWLSASEQAMQEEDSCAAVGCRVVGLENDFMTRCADYSLFSAYQSHTKKITALGSAAIMVDRKAFAAVGGFDEELMASEDWEFSLRLSAKGWICQFEPHILVRHNHGCNTFARIMKKAFLYGKRSRLITQERHREQMSALAKLSLSMRSPWLYWLLIVPYSLLVCIVQSADFIRREKRIVCYFPVMLASRLVYHCGVLRGLIEEARHAG